MTPNESPLLNTVKTLYMNPYKLVMCFANLSSNKEGEELKNRDKMIIEAGLWMQRSSLNYFLCIFLIAPNFFMLS